MDLTGDLKDSRVILLKGFLFLILCSLASAGLIAMHPSWREALLLAIALWSGARWYYFMFYVIEKYVDPRYRFAGLGSFVRFIATPDRRKYLGETPKNDVES